MPKSTSGRLVALLEPELKEEIDNDIMEAKKKLQNGYREIVKLGHVEFKKRNKIKKKEEKDGPVETRPLKS